jgi:hypothetical protein
MYLTDNDAAEVYANYEYFERPFEVECKVCRWPATGSQYELELQGWHLSSQGELCPKHAKELTDEQCISIPAANAGAATVSDEIPL